MIKKFAGFRSVFLLTIAVVALYGFTFIPEGIEVGPFSTKKVDILSDIQKDELSQRNNEYNYFMQLADAYGILVMSDVLSETNYGKSFEAEAYQAKVPISGNTAQLKAFANALKNAKSGMVRIAYFGDSAIEGDNICADFREALQEKFGGTGVGFVSITTQDKAYRGTTKLDFSSNWDSQLVTGGNPKRGAGISGGVFVPKSGSWVKYETTWKYKTVRTFDKVRVFYTEGSGSFDYEFDKGGELSAPFKTGKGVNVTDITYKGSKSFKLTATKDNQAALYGVSLESGNGVYVDNFPLRGDDGSALKRVPKGNLSDFHKLLGYDLVVLSFGLNSVDKVKDTKAYEREFAATVNHIKSAMPGVPIIIVGVGDKGKKVGSKFETNSMVPKLIEVQKNVAKSTGVAFWNLFDAMGGNGSMEKWSKDKLATADMTHLSAEGYKKVARMFFDALMDYYSKN
ncbi:MAG: hypothetical protein IPI12_09755 [Ignavibacteriales bacterium]|nr:hypothetical protein [Ignavibacteriales bacterium]